MKPTQTKDTTRNIKKQKVSYISIIVIAMLAVLVYLGINFGARGIADSGNVFYDETAFRDIEIVSTLLLTEEDLEEVRKTQGVVDCEGVYQTSAKLDKDAGAILGVDVVSLTSRINVPKVLEGKVPERAGECAIEEQVAKDTGLQIGDSIRIRGAKSDMPDHLAVNRFIITGIVWHPDHACLPVQVPGNRDIMVTQDAFNQEELKGCYMKTVLLVEGTAGMDRFGDAYHGKVEEVDKLLEKIADERAAKRTEQVTTQAQQEIDDGQKKLDDAWQELENGRKELEANRKKIEDGEAELADAKKKIEDGQKELDDAKTKLEDAKKKLDDGKKQLDENNAKLKEALKELNDGEAALREGKSKLEAGKKKLDAGKKELQSGYKKLENAKETIRTKLYKAIKAVIGKYADKIDWAKSDKSINVDDRNASATILQITKGLRIDLNKSMKDNIFTAISSTGLSEKELREAYEAVTGKIIEVSGRSKVIKFIVDKIYKKITDYNNKYQELANAAKTWDKGHKKYIKSLDKYKAAYKKYQNSERIFNAGKKAYNDGLAKFRKGKEEYDKQYAKYEQGLKDYEKGQKDLYNGRIKYNNGVDELANGKTALAEGQAKYDDGLAQYEENNAKLIDARKSLADLESCRWVVLDVNGNASYLVIDMSRKNVGDMGFAFALVFVLVGALVIFATVGRIVEEQRQLVGVTKALGLYNREIIAKYLIFGVSATAIGMVLGVILGYFGIQNILLYVYGKYFVFGAGKPAFIPGMTAIVIVLGIVLSALTVWSASTVLMKSSARELMQLPAPKVRKKGRKNAGKGSLYARLIVLNMLTDKKRVAVTIASIAGCCALLVAGFTMQYGITRTVDRQFSDIEHYDEKVIYDTTVSAAAGEDIKKILDSEGCTSISISDHDRAYGTDDGMSNGELFVADLAELNDYFVRLDINTGDVITDAGDGVWIHRKTSERLGITEGGEIIIYSGTMKPYRVRVAGVFDNFGGRYMIMSNDSYIKYFGENSDANAYLVKHGDGGAEAIKSKVEEVTGFSQIKVKAEIQQLYDSFTSVLALISLLFIFIAAMMAYFILLNLVNMFINKKKRELTIMRVNGFTVREVKRYVSLELIVSTVIGILIGWGVGSLLGYRIIMLLENDFLHFLRGVQWDSWVYAALITTLFSVVIGAIAMKKIKNLKLIDVA